MEEPNLMKQMNVTRKIILLAALFTVIILCGAICFAASNNTSNDMANIDNSNFEHALVRKSIEAKRELEKFDKVKEAMVTFQSSDNEVSAVYINIIVDDAEISASEIGALSGHITEYFEDIEEDNIYISYVDPSLSSVITPPDGT